MSRYECSAAEDVLLDLLTAGEAVSDGVLNPDETGPGQYTLVIGDPGSTACTVTGTPAELAAFAARLTALAARAEGQEER